MVLLRLLIKPWGVLLSKRFAVVGLAWWGLGPEEIAKEISHAQAPCDALVLWDIRRKMDRVVMDSPLADAEGFRRVRNFTKRSEKTYRAIFVMSPHRYSVRMLQQLKSACQQLVALLGDDPIGPRSVGGECWDYFDMVLVADEKWTSQIPSTSAQLSVMPWGSTLVASEFVDADVYVPESLVLVGTPYPQRIALAEKLSKQYPLTLQGGGWPQIPGTMLRAPAPRITTLGQLRENREMVVNVHHDQFYRGLNPQFFDYAAAGIPQLVVHADDLDTYRLGLCGAPMEGNLHTSDLLNDAAIKDLTARIVAAVREEYMFHSCVARFVS
jgi:hypothetical protein